MNTNPRKLHIQKYLLYQHHIKSRLECDITISLNHLNTMATIETELTKLLGIKYPILLAGMNKAAGPKLAAEVTNAG